MTTYDLSKLRVCEKCRVVYLPRYKIIKSNLLKKEKPINEDFCENCVKLGNAEEKEKKE